MCSDACLVLVRERVGGIEEGGRPVLYVFACASACVWCAGQFALTGAVGARSLAATLLGRGPKSLQAVPTRICRRRPFLRAA